MNRIKEVRLLRGKTQAEVARWLSITQAAYSRYECGTSQPSIEAIAILSEKYGVSIDYLLGRERKNAPPIKDEVELNDCYAIPLLGRVVAGIPIESQEDLEGYIFIDKEPKDEYFALRVNGDSMINAGIHHNSILIVHKQPYAENGNVVVALLNGEQTVKRFKLYGENIFLMPENPAFEPIPVLKGSDFFILGKVVEVRMSL